MKRENSNRGRENEIGGDKVGGRSRYACIHVCVCVCVCVCVLQWTLATALFDEIFIQFNPVLRLGKNGENNTHPPMDSTTMQKTHWVCTLCPC